MISLPRPPVVFVCATRLSVADFWLKAPLGQSLTRLQQQGVAFSLELADQNAAPLAALYNRAIAHCAAEQILVFVHDDVRLDDLFITQRLLEGLAVFDVIGVAGNRRLKARQGAWAFAEKMGQWDHAHNLLGGINHELPHRPNGFNRYGPNNAPQVVVLRGLQAGQRVVASGQFLLDSEASLKGIEAVTAGDAPLAQPVQPALHQANGRIVQIEGNQLTIAHGPFVTLGMPGMTMTFPVADPRLIAGLKVGERIRFGVRERDEGMVIEQITQQENQP